MALTVAEAADRLGRNPEMVRRWIRSDRLPARRVGRRQLIDVEDLRPILDELFPMTPLPEEWRIGDDGSLARNWVAALHRSRSGR
jgi:excisionase family DNA binding protein